MSGILARLANRLTLRAQSTLLAILVCAATVGATAATSAWIARREALELTHAQLATLAAAMAEQLDIGMFERFREIRNVARLSLVKSSWTGDPAAAREILEQLQSTLPDYAWIGFADLEGTVRSATGGLLEGVSVAERDWYSAGRDGMTVQDVHAAKLLAEKLGPNPDGSAFRLVDVAAPVLGVEGELVGVLGAHLSWSWAGDLRQQLLRSVAPGAGIELWVLASDGSVLLGPEQEAKPFAASTLAGLEPGGTTGLVDDSGAEPVLTTLAATQGVSPYPGLGWTVVARQPLSVAMAPADRLFWSILGVGSLAVLLGAAVAWRAAAGVTGPMRRLVRSADRLGRDASVRSLERVGGSRDVMVLSSALRALLRRVGTAQEQASAARRAREAAESQADAEQRRLAEQLDAARVLAERDPLTGLLNRRGFAHYAEDAWQTWRRHRRPLAVLVVDVDHFKAINDRFGHAVGDTVLASLGRVIAATVRATDKAARFGGEEFVALLRETDREGALILAERLRAAVAEELAADSGLERAVTVSLGVAPAGERDRDLGDVIQRADRALYAAKLAGRNRVEVEDSQILHAGAA